MTEQQGTLLPTDKRNHGPVECLGRTFESEEARRAHFREKLREKLADPQFRKLEGFPVGSDAEILALSDPPYFTACPNPFIDDFLAFYGKPIDPVRSYSREPFAADVSEGKNDAIYNAHSYHTKVPPKAITRYILHYTEPGDIVLDGFCGTGMTGVAARLCGDAEVLTTMGFRVDKDGTIRDADGDFVAKLGCRHAILQDISPLATFISSNYLSASRVQAVDFEREASAILNQVEEALGYLFASPDESGRDKTLEYSVWSDVFYCPNCGVELCYWDVAVDTKKWALRQHIACSECSTEFTRKDLERVWESYFDELCDQTIKRAKKLRVWDVWKDGKRRREGSVQPDRRPSLHMGSAEVVEANVPVVKIEAGDKTSDPFGSGIKWIHQYWTPRTLAVLSSFLGRASSSKYANLLRFTVTSALDSVSLRNGYRPQHKNNRSRELGGPLPGNLYVPIFSVELNPITHIRSRIRTVARMLERFSQSSDQLVSTESSGNRRIPPNSVDYIFVDPPFGSNLMYSELSYAAESWLGVRTDNQQEAIVNKSQQKEERDYTALMQSCFGSMYSALKPGRWITVEFHNSKNSIWTAIQEALTSSGFVVADVRTLSRNLGSLNQLTAANAVKQDLIISAYKPTIEQEERFKISAGAQDGVWAFVRAHLSQLPVFVTSEGEAEVIAERQGYMLFDRMVAFHVQRGVTVPLSASEFYGGLEQRFPVREGMYFLPDQAAEFDRKRMTVREVLQLTLFVNDEASAIQWLKQQLTKKPQTFQELHPQFLKEIGGWQKHEKSLELSELLEQNFLRYDGASEVPSQIHGYLSSNFKELRNLNKDDGRLCAKGKDRWYVPDPNKAGDLERLRERTLLREFEEYRASGERRLRVFRLEAVRTGFKKAWQERDYSTIIAVAQKIPGDVLQEDPKLLMWYDQALTRTGEGG
jgi:hypothetical protein